MREHPSDVALMDSLSWTTSALCEVCHWPDRQVAEHEGAQLCRRHLAYRLEYARIDGHPATLAPAR